MPKTIEILTNVELIQKLELLRDKLPLFDKLMEELKSFDKLPKHLQEDALKRIGVEKITVYKISK